MKAQEINAQRMKELVSNLDTIGLVDPKKNNLLKVS